jgi:hypothetical protein
MTPSWHVEFFHEPSNTWHPLSMRVTRAEADWIVVTLGRTQGLSCRVVQGAVDEPPPPPLPIPQPTITTTIADVVRRAPDPRPAPPPAVLPPPEPSHRDPRNAPDVRRCLRVTPSGERCCQWRGDDASFCAFHRVYTQPAMVQRRRGPRPRLDEDDCWRQASDDATAITFHVGGEDTFYDEETALYRGVAALNWPHGRIRTRVRRTNEGMPGRAVGRWRNFRRGW